MGISKQPPKPFPIKKGIPCQLKWNYSTVYLTDGKTASCHRAGFGEYDRSGTQLEFHNISNKLNEKDRKKLLKCPWPKMIIAEWEKLN